MFSYCLADYVLDGSPKQNRMAAIALLIRICIYENGHVTIPTYEIYHKCALISFFADAACR